MRELASKTFHAIDDLAKRGQMTELQKEHTDVLMPAGEAFGVPLAPVRSGSAAKIGNRDRLQPLLIFVSVLWYQGLFALPRYRDSETFLYDHVNSRRNPKTVFWTGMICHKQ